VITVFEDNVAIAQLRRSNTFLLGSFTGRECDLQPVLEPYCASLALWMQPHWYVCHSLFQLKELLYY